MKPGVPWSVKGIQPKAREAAKDAARGAGLTLGQWLNEIILEQDEPQKPAARATARSKPANGPAPATKPATKRGRAKTSAKSPARGRAAKSTRAVKAKSQPLRDNLDRLAERLDSLSHGAVGVDVSGDRDRNDDLNGLVRSMEHHQLSTQSAIESIQSDIALLAEKVGDQSMNGSAQLAPGMRALEKALFNIVDHIELTDRRNGEVLKTVQMRLSDLSTRVGGSGEGDAETAAALNLLERRLGALADRFDTLETDQGNHDYGLLENQVMTLGRRVDDAQRELRENPVIGQLEDRLDKISARLDGTEHTMSRGVDVEALTSVVANLREDFDRSATATRPAVVQALETRLSTLSGEMDTLRSDEAVKNHVVRLAERLDEVTARLSSTETCLAQAGDPHPQIAALESRVDTLVKEIADDSNGSNGTNGPSADALKGLEAQISVITDRLNQTEERFSAPLQSIEANLSQLFESLEKNRLESVKAAEQTAIKAAQKVLATSVAGTGTGATTGDHSGAFIALENGLAEVRAEAGEADRRTHETLEAVHDTLERVIERLGALEAHGQAAPQSQAAETGDPRLDDFRLPPLPGTQAATELEAGKGPEISNVPDAPEVESPNTNGKKTDEAAAAQNGTDFSRAYDVPGKTLSRNEDFIAAARRAAQAASAAVEANETTSSKVKDKISGSAKSHRRTLLFAAAALFIAVGALSVTGIIGPNLLGGSKGGKGAPATVRVPASVGSIARPAQPAGVKFVQEPLTPQSLQVPTPRAMSLTLENSPLPLPGGMVAPGPVSGQGHVVQPDRVSTMAPTGTAPARIAKSSAPTDVWAKTGAAGAANAAGQPSSLLPAAPQISALGTNLPMPPKFIGRLALRKSAAAGLPQAQFEVGARFAQGRGVARNFAKAAVWYQRAAAQGLAPAQYRLGALYEKGQGVTQDKKVARVWYQRAAEQGNIKAMHNLGVILTDATLGRPDFARAARWFQKAAQQGLTDSQYNLGVLHERGLGLERDAAKAYQWFSIAGNKGDADAAKRKSQLEKTMDAPTLAAARRAVAAWRARTPDQSANNVAGPAGGWDKPSSLTARQQISPATIARTQLLLKELGYTPGGADGIMGPKTGEAIYEFQRERGLAATGQPSHALIRQLEAAAV